VGSLHALSGVHHLDCIVFLTSLRGLLADRRAYASVASVCHRRRLSSVTLCIVTKRCVPEQKLPLTAYRKSYYEKSIGTKMNDLDLCLEVVYGHVNHYVTFAIEYLGNC